MTAVPNAEEEVLNRNESGLNAFKVERRTVTIH